MFETLMNTMIDLGKEAVKEYIDEKANEFINYTSDGSDIGDCLEELTDGVKAICNLFK